MRVGLLLLALMISLIAAFAFVNWAAIVAPTTLSLGFTDVQAPLGLILMIVIGVLTVLFLVFIIVQQAGVIVEARRFSRELKSQRELADKAEASRFTELQAYLGRELQRLEEKFAAVSSELGARVDGLDQSATLKLGESVAGLSAHLGEVEDKLDRALNSRRDA